MRSRKVLKARVEGRHQGKCLSDTTGLLTQKLTETVTVCIEYARTGSNFEGTEG